MAKKGDFIPRTRSKKRSKGLSFVNELKNSGKNYGINQIEIDLAEQLFNDFDSNLNQIIKLDQEKQEQTKNTRTSMHQFISIWRKLAAKIKVDDNYTEAVGERFGIVGEEISINPATEKPDLEVRAVPSGWEIRFNKKNYFQGINIYRKQPDDKEFKFLATDTRSPYIDTDPMQPGTQYYAYYIEGDDEVGLQSDIVSIEV